ncbi:MULTISPECIES: 3'-5' exonuclease [Clostridium]|uniref:Sporulation inhibitor KapD n=2 Tax=Clostridium TaxID=1485 RepID=A0A151ALP5_9CLOT|nr:MULTISPECIES: 3'-5' exonuclease [Clostridium]KYH28541.1 sporulation inhibitor KapD [Clostridium colicanis DSM 13634]MBE6042833.1 exonuclease domain-containing protein [Clostridium thermopalmarium]PRR74171.1 sporulation inhibitor KapD [Clostridium thermopalmarium DSM 5974]PVZ25499.1 sporulation inhibitor KapD [Clostridium thermopalmarium DSM 5974]
MSFYLVNGDNLVLVPYNIMAVDFEFVTTRIIDNKAKKYFQEIVEIGAVQKSENLVIEYSRIIKPRYFMSSSNKHQSIYGGRISFQDIKNGIDISEAFKDMEKMYIPKETIWISWGRSEYDILKNVCATYNITMPFLKEDYLDLSIEFRKFYKLKQNISLDRALNFLNIPIENRHIALPDARLVMKIAENMLINGYEIEEKFIKNL